MGIDIRDSWPTDSSSSYSATRRLNLTIPRALLALVLRVPAVVISFGIGGGVLSARWLVGDSVRVADEVEHGLP